MTVRFSVRSLLGAMAVVALLFVIAPSIPMSPIANIVQPLLLVTMAYLAFRGLMRLAN
jgi:hypothetical protein